jgi:hypothetical protein
MPSEPHQKNRKSATQPAGAKQTNVRPATGHCQGDGSFFAGPKTACRARLEDEKPALQWAPSSGSQPLAASVIG